MQVATGPFYRFHLQLNTSPIPSFNKCTSSFTKASRSDVYAFSIALFILWTKLAGSALIERGILWGRVLNAISCILPPISFMQPMVV